MNKYNVGDVVKLRDDLKDGKEYGGTDYCEEMDRMKNKPIKLLRINHVYGNSYEVEDETGENWFLSDEMIEGLWEECKEKQDKLKLIDVLNMIANGELKEGTRVKYLKNIYIYKKYEGKNYASLYREEADSPEKDLFYDERYIFITVILNNEVELIEPSCEHEWLDWETHRMGEGIIKRFRRCEKCGLEEVTEERNVGADKTIEPSKIEEIQSPEIYGGITYRIIDKLNEVIRYINKE